MIVTVARDLEENIVCTLPDLILESWELDVEIRKNGI